MAPAPEAHNYVAQRVSAGLAEAKSKPRRGDTNSLILRLRIKHQRKVRIGRASLKAFLP